MVGAGPAGLSLTLQLAAGGAAVTLVEANPASSRQLRGDALMPCGQEALAHMGLSALLADLPQRNLEGWTVWLEGRRLFTAAEPLNSLVPCRLVPQQALLEALLARALQLPSMQWQAGVAVRDLLLQGGRISGVRLADGRQLRADLVIGCDGRQSMLRQRAALTLQARGNPLDLLWFVLPPPVHGLQGEALPLDGVETVNGFNTLVGGGAIASVCRGARGELQLAWLLEEGQPTPKRSRQQWAEVLAALSPAPLARLLQEQGSRLEGPRRISVQVALAPRWHRPGLLLLGDAAHPMSPIRAQGINMALRDSLVAARQLLDAVGREEEGSLCNRLDQAAARIQALRMPEIERMQALQNSEAQQGHWLGRSALLRQFVAALAPATGPLLKQLWLTRQTPLRQGFAGALPAAELSP